MIALGVRYLTKYAAATDLSQQRPEWPPHPGRVFMAMAAAHFETGAEPVERAALEWLEACDPPALRASDCFDRSEVRTFVPVNDEHGGIVKRGRQDRSFPKVRPHEEDVFLIWSSHPETPVRAALDEVCRKVTRVGHSSSAVQMWVVPEGQEPQANLLPSSAAHVRMRVASPGTMAALVDAFNEQEIQEFDQLADALPAAKGKEKTRLKSEMHARFGGTRPESRRPLLTQWQGYGAPLENDFGEILEGPFDPNFIVLTKRQGAALGLEPTLSLSTALRNAAMRAAGETSPEWLSGHQPDGTPSRHVHVAFFPLPYVGSEYADGHVLGMGMAIPKELVLPISSSREAELRRVFGPLFYDTRSEEKEERYIKLWSKSNYWEWELERETRERPPLSLQRLTWTKPSRRWASVTPMVLHHYPKKNRDGDIERIVREGFVTAGYPQPAGVELRSVSAFAGAGHAMNIPPFTEGGAELCRYQTHVVAHFDKPLRGPVLVGRGRFRGYGLFRPLPPEEGARG